MLHLLNTLAPGALADVGWSSTVSFPVLTPLNTDGATLPARSDHRTRQRHKTHVRKTLSICGTSSIHSWEFDIQIFNQALLSTRHQPQRNTNHSTSCPSKLLLKLYQTMRCLECGHLVHLYGCVCVQCSWDSAVVGLFFCIYFFIESNVSVWRSYKMSLHSLRQKPLVIYYQENYTKHGELIVGVSFKSDTCFRSFSSPWWSSG